MAMNNVLKLRLLGMFLILLIFSGSFVVYDFVTVGTRNLENSISSKVDLLLKNIDDFKIDRVKYISSIEEMFQEASHHSVENCAHPGNMLNREVLIKKFDALKAIIELQAFFYQNRDFTVNYTSATDKLAAIDDKIIDQTMGIISKITPTEILSFPQLKSSLMHCSQSSIEDISNVEWGGMALFSLKKNGSHLNYKDLSRNFMKDDFDAVLTDRNLTGACFDDVKNKIRNTLFVYEKVDNLYHRVVVLIEN